jgi:hypothetical protein
MKRPPDSPELVRFAAAVGDILKVPPNEMQRRIEAQEREKAATSGRIPRQLPFIQNPFFFR